MRLAAPPAGAIGGGRWMLTPLTPALVMVETTDLVFAVDSIPAIFAITADPFLVFTSNVFAILGLRSLYFALAGALHFFHYLKYALALVLLTVGVKMLAHSWLEQLLGPNFSLYLLAAVILILGTGVLVSLIELRWSDQIKSTIRRTGRTLQAWVVPDHLSSTILRAAERKLSESAVPDARPESDPRPARRLVSMMKPWRHLFRGNAKNMLWLAAHPIVEYGDYCAMYL